MWWFKAKAGDTKQAEKMSDRVTNDVIDIVESILSLKLKTSVWLVTVLGTFTIGSVGSFITEWVFTPSESFLALIGVIVMDHLSGMYRAYKNHSFETKKALRIFWTLLSHTALLSFSYNMAKGSDMFENMSQGIFLSLCSVNLLSLIKNMSLLGWIPKGLADWLYKRIDVYKNEMDKKDPDNTDSGRS